MLLSILLYVIRPGDELHKAEKGTPGFSCSTLELSNLRGMLVLD